MKLEYLNDFVVLAETMNYEAAAFQLYTTQSTLSKHIQSLEEELQKPLIFHENGKSFLTEFGKDFLDYAHKHLELQLAFQSRYSNTSAPRTVLRLGYQPELEMYHCFDAVRNFSESHPDVRIILYDTSIRSSLSRGALDMAVMADTSEIVPGQKQIVLTKDQFVIVVSGSHPLSEKTHISLKELENEPFILLQDRCILTAMVKMYCMDSGFTPRIRFTLPTSHNILELVSRELGITMIPSRIAKSLLPMNAKIIELSELCPLYICLKYSQTRNLTSAENELKEAFLKEVGY